MGRQRWRDYQPTNQEQLFALLDSPRSHNSVESEYHWRSTCKCPNCIWRGPQTGNIGQSIAFDFDPDAIQVIEDVELEKLPEAVNREIMKNSEQIIFENGGENLVKLYSDQSKMQEQDSLIQRALFNKEEMTILKTSQEIISEEGKRNSLDGIIRLNKKITEILNSNQDVPENEKEDFVERMMIKSNAKNAGVLTNQETVFQEKEISEGKSDILKNSRHIEEEKLASVKVKEGSKDIRHQVRQSQHEFEKKYQIKSNEFAKRDNEACLEKWRNKRYQLITEQKSSRKYNRSLSDNSSTILSHRTDRTAFSNFGKNRINRLILPNPGQNNPKKNVSLNEKEFNKSSIDNPSAENDQKSFRIFGRNTNQLIVPNQDQRKREFLLREKQKCLKDFNRSLSDNSVTIDDARSFREFRKDTIDSTVKISEEDEKSPREIKKYHVKSVDCSNGNSISRLLNYDFLKRKNDDHRVEQRDNVGMENEKALREPLLNRPSTIAIRNKFYINNSPWSLSPVSDLSSESGFCEQSPEISSRRPRLFTRKILKNIDILSGKSNSLESNLLQKNTTNHVAQASTSIGNGTENINTNSVSSHIKLPYKNSIEDNKNSVKHSDTLNIEEQIIRTDYGIQAIDEVNKKYICPNTSSRKLISNVESEETSFTIKEQFVSEQGSIQNIDGISAKQKRTFPNVDAACKYSAKNTDCLKTFDDAREMPALGEQIRHNNDNAMKNERRIIDFSSSDIICENSTGDVIALDHPKRCNSAFTAEQVVYKNSKISRENDTVNFDRSKQHDNAFVAVNIV